MLPTRFLEFIKSLTYRTDQGEFLWNFDANRSNVLLKQEAFSLRVLYSFNSNEEHGEYVLLYFDNIKSQEYRFYTNSTFDDYDTVRQLFDAGQASNMALPF